jgi:hypothetical protein
MLCDEEYCSEKKRSIESIPHECLNDSIVWYFNEFVYFVYTK